MPSDNLLYATNQTRTIISGLKKKVTNLRAGVDSLGNELDKVDAKLDNIITQADIYKSRLEREMGREIRRLERELALLRDQVSNEPQTGQISQRELNIASSVGILTTILRIISHTADDFRLISEAFLFPAVIERIVEGNEEAYFLDEVPVSARTVISRGLEYVNWARNEFDTHLTNAKTWEQAIEPICDWWRNDALPLLYGCRDEQWDIDIPLTLTEMIAWRDVPAERPITFSKVFDAYEIYKKHKDLVYEKSGIRQLELA